jgi:hypothetical protein
LQTAARRLLKTQTALPSPETAAMLFWALLASGDHHAQVDGWQTLATKPTRSLTSPPDPLTSSRRSRHHGIFHHIPDSTAYQAQMR